MNTEMDKMTNATDPLAEAAVEVLARRIAEDAVDNFSDAWDLYPEVGEHDWIRATTRAKEIAGSVTPDAFSAAYAILEDRAEVSA